ncbi:MAG TPA: hypothetical protein VI855_02445 [Dehalococcoidia bacterium]|nr:hypothetical protein [Dehalococcoidia bacterium]
MLWIRQERVGWRKALKGVWDNWMASRAVMIRMRSGQTFQPMSINPAAMYAAVGLTRAVTFGASALTRTQEEAIAVAVSAANKCRY